MKISFLNHKFAEREPISLDLEDEIGDVVIEGFRGDNKFVITVSDAPLDKEDSRADVLAKICLQREDGKVASSRELILLYKIGIARDKFVEFHNNPYIDRNSTKKTERFVTIVSADSEGQWQPKNVLAIVGMPPE